jgi:hypothetical protein
MTYCIASEIPFFGRKTRKGLIIYVAAESGDRIKNRVVAMQDSFPLQSIPVRVITSKINLYSDTVDLERLVVAVKAAEQEFGMPVAAIVIDTLARATPGMNENTSEDMGLAIGRLDQLRERTGAAAILVHHSGKDLTKGARGWSGLRAAADHEIQITRKDDIRIVNLGSKQRDTQDGSLSSFKLLPVEIGTRSDGKIITTCIIEELNDDVPRARVKKPLPAQKQAALDILYPLGVVAADEWREACMQSPKFFASENPQVRRTAFDRAFEYLARSNTVFVNQGMVEKHPEFEP